MSESAKKRAKRAQRIFDKAVSAHRAGQLDEGIAYLEKAVRRKADYTDAHWDLALAWLMKGDLRQGSTNMSGAGSCRKISRGVSTSQPGTAPRSTAA